MVEAILDATATKLTIRSAALVVLIGPAASGKSTFARRHFSATQVLSSDYFRGLLCDDPHDQSVSGRAFGILQRIVDSRLSRGLLTVVDATNVKAASRRPLLDVAGRFGAEVVAVVFHLPEEACLEQNRGRCDAAVPDDVVRRHWRQLAASLPGLGEEGFSFVHVLRTPEQVDEASVEISDP